MNVNVTVGLCVKNSEKSVQDSIDSIINQEYPSDLIQIIIVDGCSRDNTMSIVSKAISRSDIQAEIYSDKGKGLGTARQIVVAKSTGKYTIFSDGDVTLSGDFVKEQVKFMEENPDVAVAFSKPKFQIGTTTSTITALFNYAEEVARGSTATIFRADIIRQSGGFDENITGAAEDIDLIARIQAKGWLISVNKNARFSHKYRESFSEFWREQTWFGYGSHYVNHKNKNVNPPWRSLPIGYLIFTLRTARKAYKMTLIKMSFLIPLQMALGNISWWFGFIKAHIDGYGHHFVLNQN
jgi:glycosyltransferase involved in cell wall biosynthesis